jgi:hypothetical protein
MDFIWDLFKDILVSISAFLLGFFVKTLVIPWIETLTYKGVIIKGSWSVQQVEPNLLGITLSEIRFTQVELNQSAGKLSGQATSYRLENGAQKDRNSYNVTGMIRDRFVIINFTNSDKNKIAVSTFLLLVGGNGDSMEGPRSFYGSRNESLNAINTIWKLS